MVYRSVQPPDKLGRCAVNLLGLGLVQMPGPPLGPPNSGIGTGDYAPATSKSTSLRLRVYCEVFKR